LEIAVSMIDALPCHRITLLQADPELRHAVPLDDRPSATRVMLAEARTVPRGAWTPDLACRDGHEGHALLVLKGLLLREVVLAGRRAAQVYGPGDVLRPVDLGDSSLGEAVEWSAMDAAEVAVLDDVFFAAARRWPGLSAVVLERLLAQIDRGAVQLAIAQLPRIEQRVLAMLWHLADRFGHVTSTGVVVPFPLTHETIGRLVGARRPTVSLGLTALHETGSLRRRDDGSWVLDPASRDLLDRPDRDVPEPASLRLVLGG
jgi:CRP-like cAMP-binding protein